MNVAAAASADDDDDNDNCLHAELWLKQKFIDQNSCIASIICTTNGDKNADAKRAVHYTDTEKLKEIQDHWLLACIANRRRRRRCQRRRHHHREPMKQVFHSVYFLLTSFDAFDARRRFLKMFIYLWSQWTGAHSHSGDENGLMELPMCVDSRIHFSISADKCQWTRQFITQ